MIKSVLLQGFGSCVIAFFVYILLGSILEAVFILLLLFTLIVIKPAFAILNKLTQQTKWYEIKTEDTMKFKKNIQHNLEICNLGSNSGKFSFDYEDTGLKGENWALDSQTLSYDFRVLKNYFSYLKEGATVLIPLCPFSGCIKDFEINTKNYKYYSFLHPILILNYSYTTSKKVMHFVDKPFQASPIRSIFRIISDLPSAEDKQMDVESLEADANKFIINWKQQFSISDLNAPVSAKNNDCIAYNSNLLEELISFCIERKLQPIIVIPPMTRVLSSKFSDTFRENYIFSLIKKVDIKKALFLNYIDDERFVDSTLFFNSYFLNQKGRKIFTRQILSDLGLH